MTRVSQRPQRQRTSADPLQIGAFNSTSIRLLTGKLGPTIKPNRGGYGGGTFNHWFKIKLEENGWIIIANGSTKPKFINISAYDLNKNPIEGRAIFQRDSIDQISTTDGSRQYPYRGHVQAAQSDTVNTFDPNRLDKGDDRFFALPIGEYLICISSVRNEPIDYAVGIVIEISDPFPVLLLEDFSRLIYENTPEQDDIICDTTPNFTGDDAHDHSLTEWKSAWERERPENEPFPAFLVEYTTTQ
mgnify:FL=1|tara:strand:+ start:299 stop:1030 length:732 start_codon:yes stop_codon:yes gene_type:complete